MNLFKIEHFTTESIIIYKIYLSFCISLSFLAIISSIFSYKVRENLLILEFESTSKV